MKKCTMLLLAALTLLSFSTLNAQDAKQKGLDAITMSAVKGQLEFLSSDWTQGRSTGEPGAYMAADYMASIFKIYGVQPAGDIEYTRVSRADRMAGKRPQPYRTFFQSFDLVEYTAGDNASFAIINETKAGAQKFILTKNTDFSVRTSDVGVEVDAPVVFVGYGFEDEESGYNDYKGVDVQGKAVVYLSGYPGHMDEDSKAAKAIGEKNSWTLSREKSTLAAEKGAALIIEIVPGRDVMNYWADNIPFRYNQKDYEGDKPRASYYTSRLKLPGDDLSGNVTSVSLSKRAKATLLDGADLDLEAFEKNVAESLKPASKDLDGKRVSLKADVNTRIIKAQNVVGVIPGKDTTSFIVIGAHYDHLGMHDGYIWNGADDNASGTVGVMSIAKGIMATGEKPEKTIVFAAWTGEEKGLLGSRYFSDNPYNDAEILMNLNYDMISRDNTDDKLGVKCSMSFTEAKDVFEDNTVSNNIEYELGLDINFRPSEKPRGGSDHSSFSRLDIPIMYFMAGFPPEYHQPGDHIDLVNFEKMLKIIQLGYLNIWDLANSDW